MTRGVAWLLALAACATGCWEEDRTGELGLASFHYLCVDATDPACSGQLFTDGFPPAIGVGGRFAVEADGARDIGAIESASRSFVEPRGGGFLATGPGLVVVLARSRGDGRVIDFVHVLIVEPQTLRLSTVDWSSEQPWSGSSSLQPGMSTPVVAVPIGGSVLPLAGARAYRWSSSDVGIARLRGDTAGSRVEVVAVAPGVATIEAQSGDVRGEIEITVNAGDGGAGPLDGGAVVPDEDAGASEGEADGGH